MLVKTVTLELDRDQCRVNALYLLARYDAVDGLEITARFLDHGDICKIFGVTPEVRSCR